MSIQVFVEKRGGNQASVAGKWSIAKLQRGSPELLTCHKTTGLETAFS